MQKFHNSRRLKLREAQQRDLKNNTSWVRLIEMHLEGEVSLGIMIQFFRDWEIYGLREALIYLRGYEEQGEIPKRTSDKLQVIADKIFNQFPESITSVTELNHTAKG